MKPFFKKVYAGWMKFALLLGEVVGGVIMTVLFVILVPVFSLIRLKDPLRLKLSNRPEESYWEPHEPSEPTLDRFSHPF